MVLEKNRLLTSIGGSVVEFSPATRRPGFDSPPMQTFVFNMEIWKSKAYFILIVR